MVYPMNSYICYGIQLNLKQVCNFLLEYAHEDDLNKEHYDGDSNKDVMEEYLRLLENDNGGYSPNEEPINNDELDNITSNTGDAICHFTYNYFKINGNDYKLLDIPSEVVETGKFREYYCLVSMVYENDIDIDNCGVIDKNRVDAMFNRYNNFNEEMAKADLAEVSSESPQYMHVPDYWY